MTKVKVLTIDILNKEFNKQYPTGKIERYHDKTIGVTYSTTGKVYTHNVSNLKKLADKLKLNVTDYLQDDNTYKSQFVEPIAETESLFFGL